jgi:hypothetical protein
LSRGGAVHTPRVRVQANQETATFLWVSASCVVDSVLKLIGRNDYYQFLNQITVQGLFEDQVGGMLFIDSLLSNFAFTDTGALP